MLSMDPCPTPPLSAETQLRATAPEKCSEGLSGVYFCLGLYAD